MTVANKTLAVQVQIVGAGKSKLALRPLAAIAKLLGIDLKVETKAKIMSKYAHNTKLVRPGETPSSYIKRRIEEAFSDLAGQIDLFEMTEEEAAGVPFQLFSKQDALLTCWDAILDVEKWKWHGRKKQND